MEQMGSKRMLIVALSLCAGSAVPTHASDFVVPTVISRPGFLQLRTGDVDLSSLPDVREHHKSVTTHCVIEMFGPCTPSRRLQLAERGVRVAGYLPTNSLLVQTPNKPAQAFEGLDWIRRVVSYRDEWKIAPELLAPQRRWVDPFRAQLAKRGVRVVTFWLFEGESPDALVQAVRANGGAVSSREFVSRGYCITASLNEAAVMTLAKRGEVQFVEEFSEFTLRSNNTLRGHVQSASGSNTPFYDRGIRGEFQIVGVIDSRINKDHCSFSDPEGDAPGPNHRKLLSYNTTLGSVRHGTHVAGTVAGDSGLFNDSRGIAYLSKIVYNIHPSATETSMFDRFNLHASQGARVHNNSWGADGIRAYDGPCRAIDAFQHDQEDNLIIHSVTNSSIVYNPENAKNSLAVSAAGGFGAEETMCVGGAGPTEDGRRKPEITSVGCNIISSSNTSTTCAGIAQTGTSMAAPGVSGAAVLLRQYFTDGFYPSGVANAIDARVPTGQLLKAMLVNGATDMTGVTDFPNTREGWGRVNAGNSAYFQGDSRLLALRDQRNTDSRALNTGDQHVWTLSVAAGQPLKITLAWADAPALANASFAPVNNLDLSVESPNGDLYIGNVFSGGVSVTGGSSDTLNNLEQVLIPSVTSGTWTVRVTGAAVNEGAQGYAIVATGDVTDISCPADFDLSGAVDGDDVISYFSAWDSGAPEADVDRSGGVDGDDIIVFFTGWDSGC